MNSLFRTSGGRLVLMLGGIDLLMMGVASLANDPALTRVLIALIPMLSIAVGIYIVVITTFERGGLFPISLMSLMLFLGGVYVFGLESATNAGPAGGVVLVAIGALAAAAGTMATFPPTRREQSAASTA